MIFVECLRNKIDQNFTIFDNGYKISKNEYCTMKNTKYFCNLRIKSKYNDEKSFIKNPTLKELYSKLFPEAYIPENLHNSLIDVLVTLRCYMIYVHSIDIVLINKTIENLFIINNSI